MKNLLLGLAVAFGSVACVPMAGGVVYTEPAPSADYVWVDGYYYPDAYGNWVWSDGYWVPPRAGYVFVQGSWEGGVYHAPYWRGPHGEVVIHDHTHYGHPGVRVNARAATPPPRVVEHDHSRPRPAPPAHVHVHQHR